MSVMTSRAPQEHRLTAHVRIFVVLDGDDVFGISVMLVVANAVGKLTSDCKGFTSFQTE